MNEPVAPAKPVKVKPEAGSVRKPVKVKSEGGAGRKPVKIKPETSSGPKPVKVKPEAGSGAKPAKAATVAVAGPERKPRTRPARKAAKKAKPKAPVVNFRRRLAWISLEVLGLAVTLVATIMVLLGYSANRFSGTSFFTSLLPFAIGVLGLIVAMAVLLIGWWKMRKWSQDKASLLPPVLSICLALIIGWFSMQDQFAMARGHFRTLVGGKQEAGRVTVAHQVYAAYRRYDPAQLQQMVQRAQEYDPVIKEAAREFDIDPNLLQGIAATESSFLPRDSADGGRGLFQITRVPKAIVEQAGKHLSERQLSLHNPRHNAFLAAATFKYYLAQMNDDLFLGLLAYNIGPANGGLQFIMQQYGATDFVTIQPYLQLLPRDYPIRVLSYSLAFRLWQKEGKLPAYEEGKNAIHIQRIGIPGLLADF
ncbi:MAG: transglycosylase SLT domain-containing protein [Methylococcales bacterium]|nr:transglycosylase SLT domain-containing protein [Methylococcales bacterium]